MMNKFFYSTILVGVVALSSAWLVRPDGSGDIERDQAMTVLGLTLGDRAAQDLYKAKVQAGELDVHLVRDATYDVPCTKDGGASVRWFQRSQTVDADLNYRYNGSTKNVMITGFGAGSVQNNVKCPSPYLRAKTVEGAFIPAVPVSGTQTFTVNGVEISDPMRQP